MAAGERTTVSSEMITWEEKWHNAFNAAEHTLKHMDASRVTLSTLQREIGRCNASSTKEHLDGLRERVIKQFMPRQEIDEVADLASRTAKEFAGTKGGAFPHAVFEVPRIALLGKSVDEQLKAIRKAANAAPAQLGALKTLFRETHAKADAQGTYRGELYETVNKLEEKYKEAGLAAPTTTFSTFYGLMHAEFKEKEKTWLVETLAKGSVIADPGTNAAFRAVRTTLSDTRGAPEGADEPFKPSALFAVISRAQSGIQTSTRYMRHTLPDERAKHLDTFSTIGDVLHTLRDLALTLDTEGRLTWDLADEALVSVQTKLNALMPPRTRVALDELARTGPHKLVVALTHFKAIQQFMDEKEISPHDLLSLEGITKGLGDTFGKWNEEAKTSVESLDVSASLRGFSARMAQAKRDLVEIARLYDRLQKASAEAKS